jgi:predicted transcriptional regulator
LSAPKTSTELKNEINVGASTVIHAARDLEKKRMLVEKPDGYHLTTLGKILTIKIIEIIKTIQALKKSEEFWFRHVVDGLPEEFIRDIHMLYDHELLTSSIRNVFKTLSIYIEITKKAKVFYGVSPIFVEAFIPLVKKLLNRGTEVYLVITEEVFEELKNINKKELKSLLFNKKISLFILKNSPPVAFTVTDAVFSLGLFGEEGIYDPTQDLISFDKEAINWGRKLFEYYKSRARKIVSEDL